MKRAVNRYNKATNGEVGINLKTKTYIPINIINKII